MYGSTDEGERDARTKVGGCCMQRSEPTIQSWIWSILVGIFFVCQVIMNILAGESFGSFGGASNSELSKQNPTFLTPDGLTFSVWGIIYGFQAAFVIYQFIPCFQNTYNRLTKARQWICVLFIGNCLWLPIFSNRRWFLALLFMIVMDVSLIQIYRELRITYGAADDNQKSGDLLPIVLTGDREDTDKKLSLEAPQWYTKVLIFVGFSTNLAWLVVASMVNVLVAIGNSGWGTTYTMAVNVTNSTGSFIVDTKVQVFGNEDFVIMAVCLVAMLAVVLAIRNADVPYALVSMWALWGVYRAQAEKPCAGFPVTAQSTAIAEWSQAMIIVVGIATVIGLAKAILETLLANRSQSSRASTYTD